MGEMALDQLVLGLAAAPAQPGAATVSPVEVDLFQVGVVVAIAVMVVVSLRRRFRARQIPEDEYRKRGLSILPLAFAGVKGNGAVDLHTYITNQHVNGHEAERMIRVLMSDDLVQRRVDAMGAATYVLTDEGRRAIGRSPRTTASSRTRSTAPAEAGPTFVMHGGDYIAAGGVKQQGHQNQVYGWSVPAGLDFMEQARLLVDALRSDAARSPQTAGAQQARQRIHSDLRMDLDWGVKRLRSAASTAGR